jgi:hypothetical protein
MMERPSSLNDSFAAGFDADTRNIDDSEQHDNSIRSFGAAVTGAVPHFVEEVDDRPTMGEFFREVMNNGGTHGDVACFKMVVFLVLILSAFVIGNAAFVLTTQEVHNDYQTEVSFHVCYSLRA